MQILNKIILLRVVRVRHSGAVRIQYDIIISFPRICRNEVTQEKTNRKNK